ncbi:uncharacterized protein LOC107022360 [Solanum pennellii]|uniref:ATP-dependent DNA helicase n=1 Tax=Solanum pennellii TaxID=28526 RepID=A0ABM1H042_SOLPN|nr:uncharacterized protein LOC107022360 [Solanum pennellii]
MNNDLATASSSNSTIASVAESSDLMRKPILLLSEIGRLFQQYVVDEWIKIESQRLDFASFNQALFRTDVLDGILDVLRKGEREASHIGKQRILPPSFTGGPRDMRRRYMDAIALVQRFGKPDIFLTITCNPSWPEIAEKLISTDEVQNRPDLTNDVNVEIDEIKEYQSARWVSPPEAAWRIFAFPISEMNPTVYHLQLHLDGQQLVSFKSTDNISNIANNPIIRKTMLTEFFLMNKSNKEAMDLNLLYREFPEHFVWSTTDKIWTRRKRGHVIGRVVTCHPTEGERYYLRLLLMNVRGPKSYEDLRSVNGVQYNSFREAAEKRELLLCDNNLVECMSEAASYQMPSSLRQLFAMLLIYCNPTNPRELWERFESPMSDDFSKSSNINVRQIRYKVLNYINDILHSMGRDINEFELISEYIKPSSIAREAKEVHYERNIIVSEEDLLLKDKLNSEQIKAYNIILDRVLSNKFGAFFIDGPGGTGKSFLYRALLATVRHRGLIALATASSGVAASLLPGGRTAHSRFKIPIDVDENFTCNISKQSSLASLIRDARLIVWDEISMAKKKMVEAFDLLLRDLMERNTLFGGKIVVFSGDFRQTLPVVRSGKKEDFIRECLLCSEIWNELEKLQLSKNMRATKDPDFCEFLMRIGSGKEKTNDRGKIEIPHSLIIPFTSEKESLDLLFKNTYPDLYKCCTKTSFVTSRAILTTKNDFVDDINDMLISRFSNIEKVYIAIDETIDPKDQSEYEDFLHTLNPTGLPPYKLTLKKNCPIMLLRNLNPCEGLCNGTRLICNDFKPHIYCNMAERYTINMITPDTKNWTCKVQVVDKSRPRDNKDKTTKYQVLILQDEEENQVQATIFSTDITYFEKEFAPFKTYLVSVAYVKVPPLGYENPLNKFIWTLDKNTIVEPIEEHQHD